jgi:zinc D-Ala-D-Ala carboxypeptidase
MGLEGYRVSFCFDPGFDRMGYQHIKGGVMKLDYFSEKGDPKIACQCGCGLGLKDMDLEFMLRLDAARAFAGVPFRITSGARCPTHNQAVSTTGLDGPHTKLCAVDIQAIGSRERFLIRRALIKQGFHRFGTARTFLHVDADPTGDPDVEWFY